MSQMYTRRPKQNRRYRPYRRSTNATVPNQIYSPAFPRQMKVKLSYTEILKYNTTSAIANDTVFNLNSIYDPNRSGGGHQPLGYDQWSAFYNRYRVDRVHAKLHGVGDTSTGCVFSLVGSNSDTGITSVLEPIESARAKYTIYAQGGPPALVENSYNLAQITGVTKSVYEADDRYSSLIGANPSETICLHMCTYDTGGASVTVGVTLKMEFEVTLFDPIFIGTS